MNYMDSPIDVNPPIITNLCYVRDMRGTVYVDKEPSALGISGNANFRMWCFVSISSQFGEA
jgi:hypothetical protein